MDTSSSNPDTDSDHVPISPSLDDMVQNSSFPSNPSGGDWRTLRLVGWAVPLGIAASFVALWFVRLINFMTNLCFYGRVSIAPVSPADNHLGGWVIVIPVIGGALVGIMARYGSKAIRGHGIPEAMEQILLNKSRIPPLLIFLKPISAAIAIGTGGPFGAEGPIIATGGALGSLVGQLLRITAVERKTLLACGAAAGMTAIFGSPVSSVLLALELLLFEFRPRSIIPVSIAAVTAMIVRNILFGSGPVFPIPDLTAPIGSAVFCYVVIGGLVGVASIWITRLVYAIEDGFEKTRVHWMWWPLLGAVVVGVAGYLVPATLGVGYDTIRDILSGHMMASALLVLMLFKLISWSVYLGSGTSGGTLAPLFIIGGSMGALLGQALAAFAPALGVDPRLAALVGMASIFAGASRAFLTSVVFAFETTRQPFGLLPLLGGGAAAYLISWLFMRHTIMTEKIARRGVRVPSELSADFLGQVHVREMASTDVVALDGEDTVEEIQSWLRTRAPDTLHQGFPVMSADGQRLIGLLTRRDLLDLEVGKDQPIAKLIKRAPVVIHDDNTLLEARDHMVHERVGRLPVVTRANPHVVIGILSRSDILSAHLRELHEARVTEKTPFLRIVRFWDGGPRH
jgi:H+/Cl- antiporter ClcA/CBS domain-containing protein